MLQRVGQDRPSRRAQALGSGAAPFCARQPVDEPVGAVPLEAPPDLVELLAPIAHDSFRPAIFAARTVVILVLLSVVSEWFELFSSNLGEAGLAHRPFFWPTVR